MTSKWLFSGALGFELGSLSALSGQLSVGQAALLYAGAHGLACVLLSAGIWYLLPRRYQLPLPWSPLFIFSLSFFVPLLGTLGMLLAVFPALYLPRRQPEQAWDAMSVPDLPFRPQDSKRELMFSDGGLKDVLRYASNPEQRLNALFATRRMPARDAVPILKLALRDPVDDVRLLAYSMLDQQESRINQRIETALQQLPAAAPQQRAALHATLARWYWELAYLGLAQGSVLEHVLNQAREHTRQAIEHGSGGEAQLLAGRIAMEQGRLDEAEEHFQLAEQAGIGAEKLLPFRAELAFVQGRYQAVVAHLAALPAELRQRPPFAELAGYWL